MIFTPESINLIRSGAKTQTRRPVKGRDHRTHYNAGNGWVYEVARGDRLQWCVGRTYAVCPGRGKHQVGRILLKAIRCEPVAEICHTDAMAEGLRWNDDGIACYGTRTIPGAGILTDAYLALWRTMYPKSDLTELVWVLEFEMVEP